MLDKNKQVLLDDQIYTIEELSAILKEENPKSTTESVMADIEEYIKNGDISTNISLFEVKNINALQNTLEYIDKEINKPSAFTLIDENSGIISVANCSASDVFNIKKKIKTATLHAITKKKIKVKDIMPETTTDQSIEFVKDVGKVLLSVGNDVLKGVAGVTIKTGGTLISSAFLNIRDVKKNLQNNKELARVISSIKATAK